MAVAAKVVFGISEMFWDQTLAFALSLTLHCQFWGVSQVWPGNIKVHVIVLELFHVHIYIFPHFGYFLVSLH